MILSKGPILKAYYSPARVGRYAKTTFASVRDPSQQSSLRHLLPFQSGKTRQIAGFSGFYCLCGRPTRPFFTHGYGGQRAGLYWQLHRNQKLDAQTRFEDAQTGSKIQKPSALRCRIKAEKSSVRRASLTQDCSAAQSWWEASPGRSKGRQGSRRFRLRIDGLASALRVFAPLGDESPLGD